MNKSRTVHKMTKMQKNTKKHRIFLLWLYIFEKNGTIYTVLFNGGLFYGADNIF